MSGSEFILMTDGKTRLAGVQIRRQGGLNDSPLWMTSSLERCLPVLTRSASSLTVVTSTRYTTMKYR